LKEIGLEPERVRMVNVSSAMAGQFVAYAQEMTETIKNLGLNPLRKPSLSGVKPADDADSIHLSVHSEPEVSP
jgi:hypothetical protein